MRTLGRLLNCGVSRFGPVSCLEKGLVPGKVTMLRAALRAQWVLLRINSGNVPLDWRGSVDTRSSEEIGRAVMSQGREVAKRRKTSQVQPWAGSQRPSEYHSHPQMKKLTPGVRDVAPGRMLTSYSPHPRFKPQNCVNWVWCTHVIPALRRLWEENQKFQVILGYIMNLRLA